MRIRALCCGAALSLVGSYAAACENPPLVQVPTPEEAESRETDLAGLQGEVEAYHAAMQEFTNCLKAEVDEARSDDAPELVQNLLVQRNNAAVAEVEAVITQFNQLVEEVGGGTQLEQE